MSAHVLNCCVEDDEEEEENYTGSMEQVLDLCAVLPADLHLTAVNRHTNEAECSQGMAL